MTTHEFPNKETLEEYAKTLERFAEVEITNFALVLGQELLANQIPVTHLMVETAFVVDRPVGSILVMVDADEEQTTRINRMAHQALGNLLRQEVHVLEIQSLFVLGSTDPVTQDPKHYFPGAKEIFPKIQSELL